MPGAREQNFASLDIAFDLLRRPTTVNDRLGILQHLVNFWHGPIRPEDGMSDAEVAGVSLPLPLRWWYRWAGKRAEVMSGQNHLFVPCDLARKYGQLTVKGGRLYFYAENQGVYQWSTLPHGDDPPVFVLQPQCGECFAHRGRMMSKVIDDRDAVDFTANFATPAHALKSAERIGDGLAFNSPGVGGDDRRQGIAHVKVANQRHLKPGPFRSPTEDTETRLAF